MILLAWVVELSCSHYFLNVTMPSYEAIIDAMDVLEIPCEDMHHRYYFRSKIERIDHDEFQLEICKKFGHLVVPLNMHGIYTEGC